MGLFGWFKKTDKEREEPGELSPSVIKAYNKTRSVIDPSLLCHAPFSNMYFNTEGDVALCWKTFHRAEKYTPDKTIMEIWQGDNFQRIRNGIKEANLDFGCAECKKHLLEGNYVNVLSKAYDNDHIDPVFPTIMEFELSNQCNLACTMCNGLLSSVIRREREHLPKLQSPYGDKFVMELREFIPHLKEARFNGGEPFLIKTYYNIWDEIFELNPGLKMVVATNGTVLTEKVKSYLERGNFHLNISMDGFSKATYEKIRLRGDHDLLMQNFSYFLEYCRTRKRTLCIMINPLRDNWWEMPDFVKFCNEKNIHLWFNTIIKPAELALWSLPAKELENIYKTLQSADLGSKVMNLGAIQRYNIRTFENLVQQQIKTWWLEAVKRETASEGTGYMDPSSCKIMALKKLEQYLDEDQQKGRKSMLLDKLDQLEAMIVEEDRLAHFYKSIYETDPSLMTGLLTKYSAEELKDMFDEYILSN